MLRRGRHDARAPKIMSDGRRASRGQPRTPAEVLQRVWWAGDGKGGDRDRPQAVSQVRAPRHAPWTQRAAPKLGTDVPQHPQKTARTLVRLLRASEALWASFTRLEPRPRRCGFYFLVFSEYLRAAPSNLHLALHAARGHHKEQLPQRDLPPIPPSSHPFAALPFPVAPRLGTSVPVYNILDLAFSAWLLAYARLLVYLKACCSHNRPTVAAIAALERAEVRQHTFRDKASHSPQSVPEAQTPL